MLYLFNTTIMPNEGIYTNRKISVSDAAKILFNKGFYAPDVNTIHRDTLVPTYTSAIGHQGSADAFNQIFNLTHEQSVQVNRIQAQMKPNDEAIALKVTGRLPEGQILSLQELESIGFEFYHIQMVMDIPQNPIAGNSF